MATSFNALEIRRRLGRDDWGIPKQYGEDGWGFLHKRQLSSIIVSRGVFDGISWTHASISHVDHMPTYEDLKLIHHAVWQERGWAYQVFAPPDDHVNIHANALHLWGRLDGQRPTGIPNFGMNGTI